MCMHSLGAETYSLRLRAGERDGQKGRHEVGRQKGFHNSRGPWYLYEIPHPLILHGPKSIDIQFRISVPMHPLSFSFQAILVNRHGDFSGHQYRHLSASGGRIRDCWGSITHLDSGRTALVYMDGGFLDDNKMLKVLGCHCVQLYAVACTSIAMSIDTLPFDGQSRNWMLSKLYNVVRVDMGWYNFLDGCIPFAQSMS